MADGCAGGPSPFAAYRAKQRVAQRISRHGWDPERAASTPALPRGRPLTGGGIIDSHTRYADDIAAQLFVATFPEGASQESIAEAMGMSRENARLVLDRALERFRAACRLVGITEDDFARRDARPYPR